MKNLLLTRRFHDFEINGLTLTIRDISERERATMMADSDEDVVLNRFIALVVCKVNGESVALTEDEVRDMPSNVFNRVVTEGKAHCGFSDPN